MEYTKLENINEYLSQSINPMNEPDRIFEMYSVPTFETGHPEYLSGKEIASSKLLVEKNDILLCKINPRINRVWVVGDESDKKNIASSEWIVIRNKQYNPEFLAWYFRTPKFQQLMTSEVTGIGGSLTRAQPKRVSGYPVPVLDRKLQDKIVQVLNLCTNIILNRKKQLEKLDTFIKARFVEMFGDPILNPKGWKKVHLKDCLYSIENGKSFVCANEPRQGDWPAILKLSAVTYGDYRSEENKALLNRNQFIENTEVHSGDLLFTRKNTPELVGMAAYIKETPEHLMMPDLIFRLNTRSDCSKIFLWQLINHKLFRCQIENLASGSAKSMSNISKERLLNLMIFLPPMELQQQFSAFVAQADKSKVMIQKSLDENQILFDSLMQKYFG